MKRVRGVVGFRVREAASLIVRCFELEEVMGFRSSSILTSSSNHP